MPTQPTPEQLQAFASRAPAGPVTMLNLLKFKPRAQYPDGPASDLTGQQAYQIYGREVGKLIAQLGGRLVFSGPCHSLVIGEGDLAWDAAAIVEYPSLQAFQSMTSSAAYQEIHVHRAAGLDHQLLIHCLTPEQALQLAGGAPS